MQKLGNKKHFDRNTMPDNYARSHFLHPSRVRFPKYSYTVCHITETIALRAQNHFCFKFNSQERVVIYIISKI